MKPSEIYTALIVDDNQVNCDTLQLMLRKYCLRITHILTAKSVGEGLRILENHLVHVIFLDIQLPDGDGFALIKDRLDNFDVIVVSAYEQYAIPALRYGAIDYLIKPLNIEELINAVNRLPERKSDETNPRTSINAAADEISTNDKIAIISKTSIDIVAISELIRCEAFGRCTLCVLSNGKRIVSSKNLKEFQLMLESKNFSRVHHAHLIHLKHVVHYSKRERGVVLMTNGDKIMVAQRRRSDFVLRINKMIPNP